MGIKRLECYQIVPFLISAIQFTIEQESDFQPENDVLKFPLISFCIAHLNHRSLLFPTLVWNLRYLSQFSGYYTIYCIVLKSPIQNVYLLLFAGLHAWSNANIINSYFKKHSVVLR